MRVKILLFLACLVCFCACGEDEKKEENIQEQSAPVFNKFAPISLKFLNSDEEFVVERKSDANKDLNFSSNGKAVMLVFFTTWCEPCKAEIPHLNKLAAKHSNNLQIIGVLLEDKKENEIAAFASENDIQFDLAYSDANFDFLKALDGVNAIPYIALYDKDGKNIANYIGAIYEEMLDIDIQKVIN